MKVKIGNSIHDANNEPIMLLFNNNDELKLIINQLEGMLPYGEEGSARKYCIFPDNMDMHIAKEFMKI